MRGGEWTPNPASFQAGPRPRLGAVPGGVAGTRGWGGVAFGGGADVGRASAREQPRRFSRRAPPRRTGKGWVEVARLG